MKYLNNNGVTYGNSKTNFAPDKQITRAEFTTLAVRFFDAYGDGDAEIMEQFKSFDDVSDGYWAAEYIKAAAKHGWITEYVSDNLRKLNTFPDVSRRYWAYSDILEAANAHNAILGTEESWYK